MPATREEKQAKIWQWECFDPSCHRRRRSNRARMLSNAMSATKHAQANPGHIVCVIQWSPDGLSIHRDTIQHSATPSYDGLPTF